MTYRASIWLGAALLACAAAVAQIDTPRIRPENDVDNLFQRAAASRLVVVGTVLKSQGIAQKLSKAEIEERLRRAPDGTLIGKGGAGLKSGTLYTIRNDRIVCRQSDFQVSDDRGQQYAAQQGPLLYIFVPHGESPWDNNYPEVLFQGGRYLLFLVLADKEQQEKWTSFYKLDSTNVYYRGEQKYRGVVPLEEPVPRKKLPNPSPVLGRVTQLCEALRPPELAKKLAALRKLAKTDDPVLKREAEYGIAALQRAQR